jgi:poly-gamma-glutamate capsule biosynthesis protein CapA/YwtB (metallophosphatase superfamily)
MIGPVPAAPSRRELLALGGALVSGPALQVVRERSGTSDDPGGRVGLLTLFLAGDVMTGRGIDQILPHPSDPRLFEGYVQDAREYVALAERMNGPIPRQVEFGYVWGDLLEVLNARGPDARIVNLETSITTSDEPWPKGINYRMHPANITCLTAAGLDCCVLANNHVLDWGRAGLLETLTTLSSAGIRTAGAGADARAAEAPAVVEVPGKGRVLVFAFGSGSSGIPPDWAAGVGRPGVALLDDLSPSTLMAIAARIRAARRPGDVVLVSIHWGGNWGYEVPPEQRTFAHGLIAEAGVDLVHGHSSHHPKAVEVYRGRTILYGCGDFLNDYEGIGGYETYRGDLALAWFPTIAPASGALVRLTMAPFRIRRFRLERASPSDTAWLAEVLTREGERFGTGVVSTVEGDLTLKWEGSRHE